MTDTDDKWHEILANAQAALDKHPPLEHHPMVLIPTTKDAS